MKKTVFLSIFLLLSVPAVKAQTFNIKDFGAVDDGKTLNTLSIQMAIEACHQNGGGTVYVPVGHFITGTFYLKSNINLYLENGAFIRGSADINDYAPYKSRDYDSTHYGIIYCHTAENVSITGQGVIDGNEDVFFIWDQAKELEWGGTQFTRQKDNFRKVNAGIGDGPVVPKERPRQMIIFSECRNVLVRGVSLIKSPFWTLHFADCDGVIVSGLKIRTSPETPNSDGIDVTSCSNVLISDCDIRTGDDAIAITGYAFHYELPGYHNLRHESENINITNCHLQSRSSGIRIGYEDQNCVKNIHISNINITQSNRGIGIFCRETGSLENITISNVSIETRLHTGDWWGNGEPIHISAVRGNNKSDLGGIKNVILRDLICQGESGLLIYGSEACVIENLTLENISFQFKESRLNSVAGGNFDLRGCLDPEKQLFSHDIPAFYAQHVKNLHLNHFNLTWDDVTDDFYTNGIHIRHFKDIQIIDFRGTQSPSNPELRPVFLESGNGFDGDVPELMIKKRQVTD